MLAPPLYLQTLERLTGHRFDCSPTTHDVLYSWIDDPDAEHVHAHAECLLCGLLSGCTICRTEKFLAKEMGPCEMASPRSG